MKSIDDVWKSRKETYVKHLMELTAIDTRHKGFGIDGGREKDGQDYLAELFRELGAEKVVADPMREEIIARGIERYGEGNPGHNYDQRYNLYATFRGKGGRSLLFNGHMDTMEAGDESLWHSPPLRPTLRDGRLYGLGVCDMKGGLMASVMALQLVKEAAGELPGDVLFASVVDEEGGGNGSLQAAMNGVRADGVVVCEPTGGEMIIAHMGFVFYKVSVVGKANHSGSKWLGVSAIEKALRFIRSLDDLERRWNELYKHPLLPSPSLNVGLISGGSSASTVAGSCVFDVCIHYLPDVMDARTVEEDFGNALESVCREDPWLRTHPPELSMYQAGGAFQMDADHTFVGAFRNAVQTVTNEKSVIAGSPAGSDSRIWKNIAGCPTVQYGPGNLEQCHSVDEYLSVESYLETIRVYAELILGWCTRE